MKVTRRLLRVWSASRAGQNGTKDKKKESKEEMLHQYFYADYHQYKTTQ